MNRFARLALTAFVTAGLALTGTTAASASASTPALSASPTTIAVGETTTLTASGLGGMDSIGFGLGTPASGVLLASTGDSGSKTLNVPVSGGQATAYFRASQTGSFFVDISNGERPLAQVQITVTGSAPQPTQDSQTPIIEVDSPLVVGQTTQVVAKVAGLQTVDFGLDSPDAGSFSSGTSSGPSVTAPASNGTATVDFTPSREGSVTIALSDGETVLASAVVQVSPSPATPTAAPTATATPSASPTPTATSDSGSILPWILLGVALLVIIGLTVWLILSRRRAAARGTGDTSQA